MVRVLGPFRVTTSPDSRQILQGRVGALLQTLLLHPNEVVPVEDIAANVWPSDELPDGRLRQRIQVLVSRLRRKLSDDQDLSSLSVVAFDDGYRVEADLTALDRVEFEHAAAEAISGNLDAAKRALDLWEGDPYTDFTASEELKAQRRHLVALRNRVEEVLGEGSQPDVVDAHLGSRFSPPKVDEPVLRRQILDNLPRVGETRGIFVVAPAGFGKSLLLAQWASDQTATTGWVNINSSDNDPSRFWFAVIEALRSGGIPVPDQMPPGVRQLARLLTSSLADHSELFGLVLDDVHHIVEHELITQIGEWIASLPTHVTVALGSRRSMPFNTALMESLGEFHRITASQLKFTEEETEHIAASAAEANGIETDPDQLHKLTDGWPLAVAYLSAAGDGISDPDATASLTEFIAREVLRGATDEVVSFILHTAHLEVLHPEVCDFVTGRTDSGKMLDWLAHRQLVMTGEVDGRPWHRFHHLFARLMRNRAQATPEIDIPALHLRAARWYRDRDLMEQALGHALQGNDDDIVAETSGDMLLRTALNAEYENCRRWWHALSPDTLGVNRRSHDIAMYVAIHWSDETTRQPWLESRLKWFGGVDDTILTYAQAVDDCRQGRVASAIDRVNRVIDQVPAYCERHAPDLTMAMLGQAYSTLVVARVLEAEMRHDDPHLESLVGMMRPGGPVATTMIYGCWALLAYVDGDDAAAKGLVETYQRGLAEIQGLEAMTATLGEIAATLLASDRTGDPQTQLDLARALQAEITESERDGNLIEAALARLALQQILRRAGSHQEAARELRLADALIRAFEDAPLVDRARRLWVEGPGIDGSDDPAPGLSGLPPDPTSTLTHRELTVLNYLDSDLTFDEIGEALFVSTNTIKAHTRSIYRKLGVTSRLQAVRRLRSEP
jgi:LuxR family maltose regulon positive regulatory protein